jgi:hypothetical protein
LETIGLETIRINLPALDTFGISLNLIIILKRGKEL